MVRRLLAATTGTALAAALLIVPSGDDLATVSAAVVMTPASHGGAFVADLTPMSVSATEPSSAAGDTDPVEFAGLGPGRYVLAVSSLAPDVDAGSLTCQPAHAVQSVDVASATAVLDVTAGQSVACSMQARARGSIVLTTSTVPEGAKARMSVDPSWGDGLMMADGALTTSPALRAGVYDASAQVRDGWDLTTAVCDDGSTPDAIELGPGETVTCTFEATKRGTIAVTAVTVPEGRDRRFSFDPSWGRPFKVGDDQTRTSRPLRPGVHEVDLSMPEGWDASTLECDDGSDIDAIELDAGEKVSCTLTATRRGTVTVTTRTEPAGALARAAVDPSWGKPFRVGDGQSRTSRPLRPGDHSVAVDIPDGWDVQSARCTGGDGPDDIDLAPGENVRCTIAMAKRGTITVRAASDPPGSSQTFGYDPSWGDAFSLTDQQSATSRALKPGTYSVVAQPPAGWSTGLATCDDGSDPAAIQLDPGEAVTCTFTHALPRFTVASFNILGDSHSDPGGYAARFASGPTRMGWTVGLLRARGVDVVGMQEVQPVQASAFLRQTGDFAMYPAPGSINNAQNVVAWRTSMFELVDANPNYTPYLNGNRVPMPVVKLRHRSSGLEVYVISVHNAASIDRTGNNDRWRNAAMRQQIALTNTLLNRGVPVIMTGDMNSRTQYFCAYTRSGRMKAAAGGSSGGACNPPPASRARIDWIFGSRSLQFSNYASVGSGVLGRISDHPLIVSDVLLTG